MNIVDAVIIVLLIIGALDGVRKGAIKSLVELVGSILVIFFSWILKGILSNVMISTLPQIGSNPAISVVIYQVISFIVLLIIFSIIYKVIVGLTDLVERLFDSTVILGFVSRVLGALVGLIKSYVIMFFALFILSSFNIGLINNSKVSTYILEKTPLITPFVEKTWNTIKNVYNSSNVEESIQKLFENKIITEENMNKIINKYNESKSN